jgi:hypothetical protein
MDFGPGDSEPSRNGDATRAAAALSGRSEGGVGTGTVGLWKSIAETRDAEDVPTGISGRSTHGRRSTDSGRTAASNPVFSAVFAIRKASGPTPSTTPGPLFPFGGIERFRAKFAVRSAGRSLSWRLF